MNDSSIPKRIPELDGLRGLAILPVWLWHCVGGALQPDTPLAVQVLKSLNLGWTGVDLFFVLSGFLIGGILIDHRRSANLLPVFYARRALRILPIYYLLVLAYAIARAAPWQRHWPALSDLMEPPLPLWSYGVFLQNFVFALGGHRGPLWLGPTWSLAVEEQFYLTLPLLILMVPRARLGAVLAGLIAFVPVLRIALYDLPPRPGFGSYLMMPTRADALLLGVLAAWLIRHERAAQWLRHHRKHLWMAFAVLLAGMGYIHQARLGVWSMPMMVWGNSCVSLFYFVLLLLALHAQRGPVIWLARNSVLRCLGRYSYGIYLYHVAVQGFAHALLLKQVPTLSRPVDVAVTVGAMAATFALAALSWHCLERPLVEYGHTFNYRSEAEAPMKEAETRDQRPPQDAPDPAGKRGG